MREICHHLNLRHCRPVPYEPAPELLQLIPKWSVEFIPCPPTQPHLLFCTEDVQSCISNAQVQSYFPKFCFKCLLWLPAAEGIQSQFSNTLLDLFLTFSRLITYHPIFSHSPFRISLKSHEISGCCI